MNKIASFLTLMFLVAVTFTWQMPTTNEDGSPLTDLAGARIYCGQEAGVHSLLVDAGNVTTYTDTTLPEGVTQYCVATAYDTSGNEGAKSNELFFTPWVAPGVLINFQKL